jgi:branched-subunit amino acid ABC-type transport system permease component
MNLLVPDIGFGIVTASILALAAVGFTLQFGVTNVLNLAFSEVMTASAFVAYVVNRNGLNIWIAMIVAALTGGVMSVAINRGIYTPFIRKGTKLFGIVIVSLGLNLVIQNTVLAISGPSFFSYRVGTSRNFKVLNTHFSVQQLAIIGIAISGMLAVHLLLKFTRLGKAMRATAADASLARASGVPTGRVVDLAWLISGMLCGVAGVALFLNTVSFTASTSGDFLVVIIAAAVLGGIGRAYGAMLGALVVGLATEVSAVWINPSYKTAVAFVALIVVLLARPQGILASPMLEREVQV